MEKRTVGTCDFYFDIADHLERLGVEFSLTVKHPTGDGVIVLTNVLDAELARHMIAAQGKIFRERMETTEDEDSEDEDPNPDPGSGV